MTPEPIDRVQGTVLLPSGNTRARLSEQSLDYSRILVDPQLYLAGLDADTCLKTCARLATYPWFGVENVPADGTQGRAWEADVLRPAVRRLWPGRAPIGDAIPVACEAALRFQLSARSSYVILPTPLLTDRENQGQELAEWLDCGLSFSTALDVRAPVLATVALHEAVINEAAFRPGGFLDAVVDQVCSRDDVDGVYILIAQETAAHPFDSDSKVWRAYLHLVRGFAVRPYETILTNFGDVFGLVCLGAGATGVCSGASQSSRRLALSSFREGGGGRALPRFYSNRCVGEFLPESELGTIVRARLSGRVRDLTEFSRPLLESMTRKQVPPPSWTESQNNTAEAHKHFISRLAIEAWECGRLREVAERGERVREWIEDAAANQMYLRSRLGPSQIGLLAPVQDWIEILDSSQS